VTDRNIAHVVQVAAGVRIGADARDHAVERFLLLTGCMYSLLLGRNYSIADRNILLGCSIERACGLHGPLRRDVDVARRLCGLLLLALHPAGVDADRRHDVPHHVNGYIVTISRRHDPCKEIGSPEISAEIAGHLVDIRCDSDNPRAGTPTIWQVNVASPPS
jgi:hypothetical protein